MKHAGTRRLVGGYTAAEYQNMAATWGARIGLQSVELQQPNGQSRDGSSAFGQAVGLGMEHITREDFSENLEGVPYFWRRNWASPACELGVRLEEAHPETGSTRLLYIPFMRGPDIGSLSLMHHADPIHAALIGSMVASNMHWAGLRSLSLGADNATLYLPLPVAYEP
jgi:hypothetical protein